MWEVSDPTFYDRIVAFLNNYNSLPNKALGITLLILGVLVLKWDSNISRHHGVSTSRTILLYFLKLVAVVLLTMGLLIGFHGPHRL